MRVVVYVHLPHRGLSVKLDCQLRNRWRQHAARTAPRCPEIDYDRLRALEDITGEIHLAEGGVPGVCCGHTMLLAWLWGFIDIVSWRLRPLPDCHQRLSPIRRSGDGTSYLGIPFFWPRIGTLTARRSQTPLQAEKKPLSMSEERLAAFHHRGMMVTHASRGDHEGLTPVPSSPLFLTEGFKRLT